jgi:RNA polymerase sigma factor (sigma-70 family)
MPRWLARIAHYKAYERLRQRDRGTAPAGGVAEPLAPGLLPEEVAIEAESLARLYDALEQLTDKQRRLIELLFLSPTPLSYVEVAAELQVKVGTLGRMRRRALERLRRLLDDPES